MEQRETDSELAKRLQKEGWGPVAIQAEIWRLQIERTGTIKEQFIWDDLEHEDGVPKIYDTESGPPPAELPEETKCK